jgi:hypothetical protein
MNPASTYRNSSCRASAVALIIFANAHICCAQNCDQWQPIGGSTNSFVRAMAVFQGDLIVGGDLTAAGGVPASRIARWDGQNWQALGGGVNATVYALREFNGDLIAGGSFTQAGGDPASFVARWDGKDWHAMGNQFNGLVHSFIVYNNTLIAGGDFSMKLAQWNGTAWQPFPSAPSGSVNALALFNGDLIAGGSFITAGGVTVNMVARWDGNQWHALQPSNPISPPGVNDGVRALHVHQNSLYIGGFLQLAGGQMMRGITRWDGTDFHPLSSGVMSYVFAITSLNDLLIAGGAFMTAGGIPANNIAAWDGKQWIALDTGASAAVNAVQVFSGDLLAGGFFTTAGGDSAATYLAGFTQCGGPTDCIADIDGSNAVDVADLLIVIDQWGPCPPPPQTCPANITNSGSGSNVVNVADLLAVINAWGACP